MKKRFVPDEIDLKILSILMEDAKKTYAEIGKELFISGGTVHVRIKKLIEAEVILNSQLQVDYKKLGFDITAFLGIFLEKNKYYEQVAEKLKSIPEVLELHYTTGSYSVFAKIICKDTSHLKKIIAKKIQQLQGVQRTETFISLDKPFQRPLKLD
jgi:Lrp/AsnC family transcriptional regulator for asnA, asnC and gidA